MTQQEIPRPGDRYRPRPEGLNAAFYEACSQGVLHLQRCAACGRFRHPPRHRCPSCGSADLEWAPSAGRGRLFTWTVTHHPFDRGWADVIPYATAVVELDEGVRLVGAVTGLPPSELRIDLPMRAEMAPVDDGFVFITFRPA